jgi:hypothetical protein
MDSAFGSNGTGNLYSARDLLKLSLCQSQGITLVVIPYWYCEFTLTFLFSLLMLRWDGEMDSLSATLYNARPDVFPMSASSPIPSEMPDSVDFMNQNGNRKRENARAHFEIE